MIDTDKYEGHTDDYIWTWKQYASHFDHDADRALIHDAPLLLAEVMRLRGLIEDIESMIPDNHEEVSPILSDILSECHRVLPMFNGVIE